MSLTLSPDASWLTLHSGPEQGQIERAQNLAEDLLLVVRQEYAKAQAILQQQSMGMHYGGYDPNAMAMGVSRTGITKGPVLMTNIRVICRNKQLAQYHLSPASSHLQRLVVRLTRTVTTRSLLTGKLDWYFPMHTVDQSRRAAYGYDVNSQQFKDWAASLQQQQAQQASQYYQQPQQPSAPAPAPPSSAPPPAPPSEAPPPPPPPA